jgi:hypothetical protein
MGTDGQTNKQTNGRMDGRTNIYSIIRDKLSLPHGSSDCPLVTFLGPRDEWMKKAGKYKYLYEMDTEIAYNWLRVGSMQITQVSKIELLIGLTMFVME